MRPRKKRVSDDESVVRSTRTTLDRTNADDAPRTTTRGAWITGPASASRDASPHAHSTRCSPGRPASPRGLPECAMPLCFERARRVPRRADGSIGRASAWFDRNHAAPRRGRVGFDRTRIHRSIGGPLLIDRRRPRRPRSPSHEAGGDAQVNLPADVPWTQNLSSGIFASSDDHVRGSHVALRRGFHASTRRKKSASKISIPFQRSAEASSFQT